MQIFRTRTDKLYSSPVTTNRAAPCSTFSRRRLGFFSRQAGRDWASFTGILASTAWTDAKPVARAGPTVRLAGNSIDDGRSRWWLFGPVRSGIKAERTTIDQASTSPASWMMSTFTDHCRLRGLNADSGTTWFPSTSPVLAPHGLRCGRQREEKR